MQLQGHLARDSLTVLTRQQHAVEAGIMPKKRAQKTGSAGREDHSAAHFVSQLGARLAESGVLGLGSNDPKEIATVLEAPFSAAIQQVGAGTPLRAALDSDRAAYLEALVATVLGADVHRGSGHEAEIGVEASTEAWLSSAVVADAIDAACHGDERPLAQCKHTSWRKFCSLVWCSREPLYAHDLGKLRIDLRWVRRSQTLVILPKHRWVGRDSWFVCRCPCKSQTSGSSRSPGRRLTIVASSFVPLARVCTTHRLDCLT